MNSASERANGRASSPVLTFIFFVVPDHSAVVAAEGGEVVKGPGEGASLRGELRPRMWLEEELAMMESESRNA